jgi:osmotically-inducible protein OsmY
MLHKNIVILACLIFISSLYGCAAPLVVAGGAAAGATAADRRTTGTMVDDNSIELKISNAIYSDAGMKKSVHINTTSFNGIVLLSGEAATAEMRNKSARLAQKVANVRQIHNEIFVAPLSTLKARSGDSWITTKTKTVMLGTKGVNALNIKVVTENQIVYLMGLVNRDEANIAANVARNISGVKQVIKLFETK